MKLRDGCPSFDGEYRVHKGQGGVTSLKYNFKPDSIDKARAGRLIEGVDEHTLELHGTQDSTVLFKGPKQPCKDTDYLLVFDEPTQTFSLEKVDHVYRLSQCRTASNGKGNKRSNPTIPPSSKAARPAAAATWKKAKKQTGDKRRVSRDNDSDVDDIANMLEEELERPVEHAPASTSTAGQDVKGPISMRGFSGLRVRQEEETSSEEE